MSTPRSLPVVDTISEEFWDAASRNKLVIQRCATCRRYQHPPFAMCQGCGSFHMSFKRVSGFGRLYSWSIVHQPFVETWKASVPFLTALIELDEQPGLLLPTDASGETRKYWAAVEPKISMRVRVYFEAANGHRLPQFVPDLGGQ